MSLRTIHVAIPRAEYDVVIGAGLLGEVGSRLREVHAPCKVALISDESVGALVGNQVDAELAKHEFEVTALSVPPGESSKSWEMAGQILEALAAAGIGRDDLVVALGGGVVGDLAGFVAAVYLRGIAFVQLPTTLLAMVDSSVGGKTAVDLSAGKNLAGAFKQPTAVLADTDVLTSLPDEEWRSGLAEAAKSAILDGEEFMAWAEANAARILAREPLVVEELVARCVAFKAGVVARDETEEGPRECLNYGHTLGHAIEKVAGFGTFTHGAAVAEGVRFASRVAIDAGEGDVAFAKRQDRLLDALSLEPIAAVLEPDLLAHSMKSDKKARAGAVRMVLVDAPGKWRCETVSDAVVEAHLAAWASTKGEG